MNKLMGLIFLVSIFNASFAQDKHLTVGDAIPAFSLKDQDNKTFSSREYIGKKTLIIYFYPKDESSGCTKEACTFRDNYADFTNAGALVIGINSGTVESHKSFAKNHQLPFPILSDPGNKVLNEFGVKGMLFFTGRETFVVGVNGKILYTYDSFMKGGEHPAKVMAFIKQGQAK